LLLAGPAIDASTCILPTDQRGFPRPITDTACDIGAFELQIPLLGSVTVSPLTTLTPTISWGYGDLPPAQRRGFHVQVSTASGVDQGMMMWDTGLIPFSQGSAPSSIVYGDMVPPTLGLSPHVTYYARVQAFDGQTWGEWSETSFVIDLPPNAVDDGPLGLTRTRHCQLTARYCFRMIRIPKRIACPYHNRCGSSKGVPITDNGDGTYTYNQTSQFDYLAADVTGKRYIHLYDQ